MKYAVEMGSSAMIYTSSFVKIGSAIRKVDWGEGVVYTDSMEVT
jgi:hypothetical protein